MIYLLDVNALVALGFDSHQFHSRVATWVRAEDAPHLATSSITELGFVRVLAQTPAYDLTVTQARTLLIRLKRSPAARFAFLADGNDISYLPGWVKTPKQITDGHLVKLATANGAVLTTLDENIPGTFVVPW
jgi:predicted nucleic acid-binding protein